MNWPPASYNLGARRAEQDAITSIDTRMIRLMRLVLALSALVIIYLDPAEPARLVALTYSALACYCLFSLTLYLLTGRRPRVRPLRAAHWIDVGWYLLFILLSGGTSSVFFFFFFFAIMVAAFRWGCAEGLRVTLAAALLFTAVGYASAPAGAGFELNRFLLRPVYLLVLGYMMAYWGGREIVLKRRLALLKEVNRLSNPRFGVDQTIASLMEHVRAFFDADACLLVLRDGPTHQLRRAERGRADNNVRAEPAPPELFAALMPLPARLAVVFQRADGPVPRAQKIYAYDLAEGRTATADADACAALADLLECGSFITVPLVLREQLIGRFYLTARRRVYDPSDLEFVRQLVEQLLPTIEHVRLLDRLASEAAGRERTKISHDLHDSTIQPYIGLKLALEGLRRRIPPDTPWAREVDELIARAAESIGELRGYVHRLRGAGAEQPETALLSAVRQQALRFREFYGIDVEVEAPAGVSVSDRLAAEAFQIVREGLSNIRRHTQARRAQISMRCADDEFVLRITNDAAAETNGFVPRSISERAAALGGAAHVERRDGQTTVAVVIPL